MWENEHLPYDPLWEVRVIYETLHLTSSWTAANDRLWDVICMYMYRYNLLPLLNYWRAWYCIVFAVIPVNRVILVKGLRENTWVVRVPLRGCIRSTRIIWSRTRNSKKNSKSCLNSNMPRSSKCLEDVFQSEKQAKQVCWRLWNSLRLIFSSSNFFCLCHNSFQSSSFAKNNNLMLHFVMRYFRCRWWLNK